MQTGSSAWWMLVDRVRERAESAGLIGSAATLMACTGRASPFLVVCRDEARERESDRAVPGAMPFILGDADRDGQRRVALVQRPVVTGHVRLGRRRICRRQGGLDADDFSLLWHCLQGRDALALIPARPDGWAETPRTMDLIPLPLHPQLGLPAAGALIRADLRNRTGCVPGWAFPHCVAAVSPDWLAQPGQGGRIAWVLYLRMRRALLGKRGDGDFHLLATRRWMWMIPHPAGPALDYAGVFTVTSSAQWESLMRSGPWAALTGVAEEEASLCG